MPGKNVVEFSILGKDRFSKQFASLRSTINTTVKTAAVFGTAFAAAMGVASKSVIDVGSKTENLRIRMNAMLGSVAEGNKTFEAMSDFASRVPFAYEDIMSSATQLSGILKGGSEEIANTMPMIADLAAVSGLSIQQTTEQVVRMFSAGAGAADLFRERGVTAMLGFQAGVSYSAEETRARMIEAFEDPQSKFAGAANELATTWTGIMSMIGDKWFQIKQQIADEGLFNYFKALAVTIDNLMGKALDNTKDNAQKWSNFIIDSIRAVADAVAWVADIFAGLKVVWAGLQFVFAKIAQGIIFQISMMAEGIRNIANLIPGIDIGPFNVLNGALARSTSRAGELKEELENLVQETANNMPSEAIKGFMQEVEIVFDKLQLESEKLANAQVEDQKRVTAETLEELDRRVQGMVDSNQKQLDLLITYSQDFSEIFNLTMSDIFNNAQTLGQSVADIIKSTYSSLTRGIGNAVATAIVDGKKLSDAFKNILKQVLKQIISMFITMGVQRLIMSTIFGTASMTEAAAQLSSAFAQTYANAFASTAAIPIIGPILAPGVAAASLAAVQAGSIGAAAAGKATGFSVTGVAHGGLENVPRESTFLLDKGERVLSPNQNTDLTEFLANENTGGKNITVQNVNIISVSDLEGLQDSDLEEFVAAKVIPTLDKLDDAGVRQKAIERSNL